MTQNKIFVVNKPRFISSNNYLRKIKKRHNLKKVGFSGTLDPFAKGTLICASGQYTKLFRFLKKAPKIYRGTIWLGVISPSLDIENIKEIKNHKILQIDDVISVIKNLKEKRHIKYIPPKFSAKRIDGKRAYQLAREDKEIKLKECEMEIFDITFINYCHPFITYEAKVSEGSYIRSLSQVILENLHSVGTMSFLHRLKEGKFDFENERNLDIIQYLNLKENSFLGLSEDLLLGKKLDIQDFKHKNNGIYMIYLKNFLSVIQINEDKVSYLLNRIAIC
jgi:tRNA pseudouridine55 synthase